MPSATSSAATRAPPHRPDADVGSHYDTVADADRFDGRLASCRRWLSPSICTASDGSYHLIWKSSDSPRKRACEFPRFTLAAAPLPAASIRRFCSEATRMACARHGPSETALDMSAMKCWRGRHNAGTSKFTSSRVLSCCDRPAGRSSPRRRNGTFPRGHSRCRRACGHCPDGASA